jgi:hypothetical protein
MAGIIAFHIVMLLLLMCIATRVVPAHVVSTMVAVLHKSIGITTPPESQVRIIALVWVGSVIVMVDGCLLLLVFMTTFSSAR